jgi:CheY-like chemotaxis protein
MDAILIVDDNEDVLELLPHLLTEDFGQTHRIFLLLKVF